MLSRADGDFFWKWIRVEPGNEDHLLVLSDDGRVERKLWFVPAEFHGASSLSAKQGGYVNRSTPEFDLPSWVSTTASASFYGNDVVIDVGHGKALVPFWWFK